MEKNKARTAVDFLFDFHTLETKSAGIRRGPSVLTLTQLRFIVDTAQDQRDQAQQACKKSGEVFRLAKERFRTAASTLRKAEARLRNAERKVIFRRSGVIAKLTYDSFRDPLPVGVRSWRPTSRQLLYQAGSYYADFRLEYERNAPDLTVVGQITNRDLQDGNAAQLPVLLVSAKSVVAETRSNQFGEFQVTCKAARSLRLCALLPGEDEVLQIPLAECFPYQITDSS